MIKLLNQIIHPVLDVISSKVVMVINLKAKDKKCEI